MSKALLIVGLPGSGKTYLARSILSIRLQFESGWVLFDDPMTWYDIAAVQASIKAGKPIIITDPHLCITPVRTSAVAKLTEWGVTEFEWIYYENNPDACLKNVQDRDDRKVSEFIRSVTKQYEIPDGILQAKVWEKS